MRRSTIAGITVLSVGVVAAIGIFAYLLSSRKSSPATRSAREPSSLEVVRSKDYPDGDPIRRGTLLSKEDGVLNIGSGQVGVIAKIDSRTGKESFSIKYDGPTSQVYVHSYTLMYEDVTVYPDPQKLPQDQVTVVEQRLERVDSLDDTQGIIELSVWGEKSADIALAEIIVFRVIRPASRN